MHSFWQRLNAIFFFALSGLGFLSFIGAGMTYWHVSTPRIELTLEKIVMRKIYGARSRRSRPADSATARQPDRLPACLLWAAPAARAHHGPYATATDRQRRPRREPPSSHAAGAGHDQAVLTLGIDADLRTVFNWNVKQLFVYVTAEYETEPNVLNQVVVWDLTLTQP